MIKLRTLTTHFRSVPRTLLNPFGTIRTKWTHRRKWDEEPLMSTQNGKETFRMHTILFNIYQASQNCLGLDIKLGGESLHVTGNWSFLQETLLTRPQTLPPSPSSTSLMCRYLTPEESWKFLSLFIRCMFRNQKVSQSHFSGNFKVLLFSFVIIKFLISLRIVKFQWNVLKKKIQWNALNYFWTTYSVFYRNQRFLF